MKSTNKWNGFNHNLDNGNFQKFPNSLLHLLWLMIGLHWLTDDDDAFFY